MAIVNGTAIAQIRHGLPQILQAKYTALVHRHTKKQNPQLAGCIEFLCQKCQKRRCIATSWMCPSCDFSCSSWLASQAIPPPQGSTGTSHGVHGFCR
jgi:hypothetical protein